MSEEDFHEISKIAGAMIPNTYKTHQPSIRKPRVITPQRKQSKPKVTTQITIGHVFGIIALIDFLSIIYVINLLNSLVASPTSYGLLEGAFLVLLSYFWLVTAPIRFIFYLGNGDC